MENRIALIGIMIEDIQAVPKINAILHDYNQYNIGRMGLPYRDKGLHIISVAMDAPNDIISSLSGKLGMIDGVTAKTIYAKEQKNNTKGTI